MWEIYSAHASKHEQQEAQKDGKLKAEDSSIAHIFLIACDGWTPCLGSARPNTTSSPENYLFTIVEEQEYKMHKAESVRSCSRISELCSILTDKCPSQEPSRQATDTFLHAVFVHIFLTDGSKAFPGFNGIKHNSVL